jgi:hypothetical protein
LAGTTSPKEWFHFTSRTFPAGGLPVEIGQSGRRLVALESKVQNALRKSFCSYHYEMFGSSDRAAEYAGHNIRTLIKTYRHAVAHEEAEKFWAIFP